MLTHYRTQSLPTLCAKPTPSAEESGTPKHVRPTETERAAPRPHPQQREPGLVRLRAAPLRHRRGCGRGCESRRRRPRAAGAAALLRHPAPRPAAGTPVVRLQTALPVDRYGRRRFVSGGCLVILQVLPRRLGLRRASTAAGARPRGGSRRRESVAGRCADEGSETVTTRSAGLRRKMAGDADSDLRGL